MTKSVIAVLFAFAISVLVLSAPVTTPAQSDPCSEHQQYCPICGDPGIGYFNCVHEITILSVCEIKTCACSPAPEDHNKCLTAGNPICVTDGNVYIEETDTRIPGLSNGLSLVRTWNSMWPAIESAFQIGMFGPNWRSNYEERVFVGSDHYLKYSRGDGSFWSFGNNGIVWSVVAPANVAATLTPGATYWTLMFHNGEQRRFDNTSGRLIAIIDRNGNTTTLSLDSLSRLVTVTDPASRHLYFTYGTGGSYLVTSVTSDLGVSVSYAYDGQGRLSQVTEPDQSTLSFTYSSQSLISSVTDANGKVLESHTYDSSGRGLTSSRANGVDAVTIAY